MRQQLLWMPKGKTARGSVPWTGVQPRRVWTLYKETDEKKPPAFPFTPVHLQTAFLEDHVHDWVLRHGEFWYYSRVVDLRETGVWLLMEWDQ